MDTHDNNSLKRSILAVGALAIVAMLIALSLSFIYLRTKPLIQANQNAWEMRQINQLIDANDYDNDIFTDLIMIYPDDIDAQLLGAGAQHYILRARLQGQPRAAVMQVTANNGYSGPIELMVGINLDGTLTGVRVTHHRETPGLGDRIEIGKSDWIRQFDQQSLRNPAKNAWKVAKDGGEFDQITGATVTPRTVVAAVRDALIYFESHRAEIFSKAAQPQDIE